MSVLQQSDCSWTDATHSIDHDIQELLSQNILCNSHFAFQKLPSSSTSSSMLVVYHGMHIPIELFHYSKHKPNFPWTISSFLKARLAV